MQLVFDAMPGSCSECGIDFEDDFHVYPVKVCRRFHSRGHCVACSAVYPSPSCVRRNVDVGHSASPSALNVVWQGQRLCLPSRKGWNKRRDVWPTSLTAVPFFHTPADKFRKIACYIRLSSDSFRRRIFLSLTLRRLDIIRRKC